MAGGKETPRQKLIGMMYLVLLALLALQVSSVIIEKFQFINISLEKAVADADVRNTELLNRIEHSVEEGKNAKDDVEIFKQAQLVRESTQSLVSYIRKLKEELIEKTGGRDENGKIIGAKEEEKVANYMLGAGESKSGEGYALQEKLNSFSLFLNTELDKLGEGQKKFLQLAMNGDQDPLFKDNKEHKRKDFAHLNFEGTPLVAALAVLTEKEAKVMALENEMLSLLANKVGANIIPIDKVRPVVKAKSNRVVAGTKYEAEMFMAAYSSSFKPQMTYNKANVNVNTEGIGNVNFKARGGNYQDGVAKRTWTGTIIYPKPNGEDSVYTITQEYYVIKPAVQVISAAVQSLYRNCGNELNIQVPALGADYKPTFKAVGAEVISKGKGLVTIIPKAKNVSVEVLNDGVLIEKLNFKAKGVPSAEITCNLNTRTGVSAAKLRKVKLYANVPSEFKELLPNESKYKVTKWKAYLVRGRKPVAQKIITSSSARLSEFASLAKEGDRLMIEILEAKRKNFRGSTEEVKFTTPIINVPII
ncbi:MAG: gliding motility protein GldM [Cytophagales bacterium]|nr:gliding motility protein GldM [Cytophagales bacterium]